MTSPIDPIDAVEAAELVQAARRAAVSRGCGWNTAEDLAQEALARVLVAAARLDPAARLRSRSPPPATWLSTLSGQRPGTGATSTGCWSRPNRCSPTMSCSPRSNPRR